MQREVHVMIAGPRDLAHSALLVAGHPGLGPASVAPALRRQIAPFPRAWAFGAGPVGVAGPIEKSRASFGGARSKAIALSSRPALAKVSKSNLC
jgi:hypothetical protein